MRARPPAWKLLSVVGISLFTAATLLMFEPPDMPFERFVQEFLLAFWTRPFMFGQSYGSTLLLLVKGAALAVALWFSARLIARVIRVFLDRTQLEEGRKFALQRISAKMIFVFGVLTGIHAFGLDIGNLAIFSGGLGIGLGLGFQSIAKNFASGLILLVEQPVKVGDRVEVAGLQGDIVTIGFRATWVRTNDNVVVVVPNSEFIELQVTNLTLNDRSVRINVPVGVSYDSDPELVQKCLYAAVRSHPDVLDDPKPDVIFKGFGDSSLDFNVRIWTAKRVTNPGVLASEVYFRVYSALKRDGIDIPYPQRDIHIRSVSETIPAAWSANGEPITAGSVPTSAQFRGSAGASVAASAGPNIEQGRQPRPDEVSIRKPRPEGVSDISAQDS